MGDSIIYGAKCLLDGKWYIGKTNRTLEDRQKEHEHAASTNSPDLFHKTMQDYGLRNFEWQELERCPENEVFAREKKWIRDLAAQSIETLNTTHARKDNKTVGVASKNKVNSKIAGARAFEKPSAKKWMQLSGRLLPCINLQTGEKFESLLDADRKSPDSRPGIKNSCEKGRPTQRGNRYAFLDLEGNPILTEVYKKALPRTQRVKDLYMGKIYDSVTEASKSSGASKNIIQGCCIGKYKTARGIPFCYVGNDGEEMLTETHKAYKAEMEHKKSIAFEAWRIDDIERKHSVITDTAEKLAGLIGINRSHILAICKGERQHDHGWRVAFYDKALKQSNLKEAHLAKIKKQIRRVICLNDNQTYDSIAEAAKRYGLVADQIRQCCEGILKGTGRNSQDRIRRRFVCLDQNGKPILTPKHSEPFETPGDVRLFCPQTGKKYQSIAHCSRETGIPQKRIRRYLKDPTVGLAGILLIQIK
jgi:hypothetical protein